MLGREINKTIIFEPLVGGHYTNYIEALCEFVCASSALKGRRVIFVVSNCMLEDKRIARFRNRLEFDVISPKYRFSPSFGLRKFGAYSKFLSHLWVQYIEALERHQPDDVIIPTADHLSQASFFSGGPRLRPRTTAILHQSRACAGDAKGYIKRLAYESIWALSPWDKMLLVNPQAYCERVLLKKSSQRYGLSPHPVPLVDLIDRNEARSRLGLDVDVDHVGIVGSIGVRLDLKAIFESFKAAKFDNGTKLLLAGAPAHNAHREFIEEELRDPGLQKAVIFLDRYLSKDELHIYYRACNVVMPYYQDTSGLSANLLLAASSNVLALVADHGFGKWLVNRFPDIGASASSSPETMSQVLKELLRRSKAERFPSERIKNLLEYNSYQNFARSAFSLETTTSPYLT